MFALYFNFSVFSKFSYFGTNTLVKLGENRRVVEQVGYTLVSLDRKSTLSSQ